MAALFVVFYAFHNQAFAQSANSARDIIRGDWETQMGWWLGTVNAHRAYDAGFTGKGVNIGILDSGLQHRHREFRGRLSGYSLDVDSGGAVTGDTVGKNGHGTGVAAVAVANRDQFGMHGVAYDALVTPIHDGEISGLDDALVKTYAYLAAVGGEIVNVSSGVGIPTTHFTQVEADDITEDMLAAVRRGVDDGIVTVVSAGNDRHSEPDFLAGIPYFYPELERGWLAVVASRSDDQLASYSQACGVAANWCIAAPGGDRGAADGSFKEELFLLPSASGGYYLSAGTSFAAPLVAGALAVTREIFPDAPIGDVRKLLLRTAVDAGAPGVDPVFGWGRLDLGNVVDTISPAGRSIFAGAVQTRQLSIEQVSKLPFGPRTRSSRMRAMWAAGNFARARTDAGSSGKTRSQSRSLAAGLDLLDQQGLTAGIGLAVARGTTSETGTVNTAQNDGLFGLGYADWESGRWYAKGAAGAGYLRQKHTRRSIPGLSGTVMEFENHQARSRTNGLGVFTRLEAGSSFETALAEISLFGRFAASSQKLKGFRESDVDVLAYTVERGGLTTATAGPGLRLARSFASGGWTFTPEVEISYARVLGDRAPAVDAALLERPMEARTGALGRDVLGLGANLSFSNAQTGLTARLGYKGSYRRNARQGSVQFSLSLAF